MSSLPEVPALVDVPCVSAQIDDSLLGVLRDRVSRHGSVSSHPPVQIEELQERPGSILVRWCKVRRSTETWFYLFIYGCSNVKINPERLTLRWTRTSPQQSTGCSTGAQAVGGASMRTPTSGGTASSWSCTWTLIRTTCSGSVPAERVGLSGAPGASLSRATPPWPRMVGGVRPFSGPDRT